MARRLVCVINNYDRPVFPAAVYSGQGHA